MTIIINYMSLNDLHTISYGVSTSNLYLNRKIIVYYTVKLQTFTVQLNFLLLKNYCILNCKVTASFPAKFHFLLLKNCSILYCKIALHFIVNYRLHQNVLQLSTTQFVHLSRDWSTRLWQKRHFTHGEGLLREHKRT